MSQFFKEIKSDWIAHGRNSYRAGFRTLLVYRFGVWRMKIKSKVFRVPMSILYRFMERRVRFKYGIELPYTVKLGERVIFEHQHGMIIHGNTIIGDDCIIRQNVTIGNRYADRASEAPILGDRVNVGAGAQILGSVSIGNDVNIGANAVVLHDVNDGETVVGIPARKI